MTILELGKQFKSLFGFNPPIDMVMTALRGPQKAAIDIIKLDKVLSEKDREYDDVKCTYKGKSGYSMKGYITEKYGVSAAEFVFNNM